MSIKNVEILKTIANVDYKILLQTSIEIDPSISNGLK